MFLLMEKDKLEAFKLMKKLVGIKVQILKINLNQRVYDNSIFFIIINNNSNLKPNIDYFF